MDAPRSPRQLIPLDPEISRSSHSEWQRRRDAGATDREIIEHLYARYEQPVRRYVSSWLTDPGAIEEVTLDVMLKMHKSLDQLITRDTVEPWLITTAKTSAIDMYRHDMARPPRASSHHIIDDISEVAPRFESEVETWVSEVEPVILYLRALVGVGMLRAPHLEAFWHGVVAGVPQRELGENLGVTQGRVSQIKNEVGSSVRASMYVCELLGLVRAPQREQPIREHLELLRFAAEVTEEDRGLLWTAGAALRRGPAGLELAPADAQEAINPMGKDLFDLHDAESRYAGAIPNLSPTCILQTCLLHAMPG